MRIVFGTQEKDVKIIQYSKTMPLVCGTFLYGYGYLYNERKIENYYS